MAKKRATRPKITAMNRLAIVQLEMARAEAIDAVALLVARRVIVVDAQRERDECARELRLADAALTAAQNACGEASCALERLVRERAGDHGPGPGW